MIPTPIATQPNPARNPAVAPHASVVFGSFRNIARFTAITRLSTKLAVNTPPPAFGPSPSNPFARRHTRPNNTEYHSPPTTNADNAATRIAQGFSVFKSIVPYLPFSPCLYPISPRHFFQ